MVWWRTWMRTLEEQNSLSRYASMTLQMLSHKDEGQMKGWRGPLSAEPLGVLAVLGVVFPRSLQDMPTRLEELLTIQIWIRQRMQQRKLLGAEAGVPVSGGKREGTQYDL
ncbi:hypothetical protein Salat_2965200 [Sesamum alatum]|uniref:Uncharacterized protein n=1 Tax=Sesamum alatum TaxID=300844 RepID=A0AAE1XIM0_9LAMI|nr:hypothetical protein Salat_2971600 [Sesamum alatum]KAK4412239.1 hypothetical protein Salat_2965200 [Sesamum alatum]